MQYFRVLDLRAPARNSIHRISGPGLVEAGARFSFKDSKD